MSRKLSTTIIIIDNIKIYIIDNISVALEVSLNQ